MKRAPVRQRRTTATGTVMLSVRCPICEHRHWFPDTDEPVRCPRKIRKAPFVIGVRR